MGCRERLVVCGMLCLYTHLHIPRRHWGRSGPLTTWTLHFQSLSLEVLPSLGGRQTKPRQAPECSTEACASETGVCCHITSHSSEGEEPFACVHKGSKHIRCFLKSEVPWGSLNYLRPLSHRAQGRDLESCVSVALLNRLLLTVWLAFRSCAQ